MRGFTCTVFLGGDIYRIVQLHEKAQFDCVYVEGAVGSGEPTEGMKNNSFPKCVGKSSNLLPEAFLASTLCLF